MKKRFLCLSLTLMLSATQVLTVSASREDELKQLQAYTSYALNDAYNRINDLEYQKAVLREEINNLDANLMNILISVTALENSISRKEKDIEKTSKDLAKAEKARDKQYEDMKKRIQAIYEKGGDSAWFQMLMEADDISELLNRAEYTQKLYKYDRECLDKYTNIVEQVEKLNKQYKEEKSQLEEMHNEYSLQQEELQNQISYLEATSSDFDAEIAYAQQQAYEYTLLLEQQTAEIYQLEAERIAAEQAAAAAAMQAQMEAAAQQAAMQQAAVQENAVVEDSAAVAAGQAYTQEYVYDAAGNITGVNTYDIYGNVLDTSSFAGNYDNSQSNQITVTEDGFDGQDTVITDTTIDDFNSGSTFEIVENSEIEELPVMQQDSHGNNIVDSSSIVNTPVTNTSGSAGGSVVDFATQFVGNPYVWGGTSLTNGADCSGFVQSVYSNFGVSLPRTTYDQINSGTEVSYADAQAGDLIVYDGHVAIYMGNGQIVHAANEEQGIIISNNPTYDTILSVRRVI